MPQLMSHVLCSYCSMDVEDGAIQIPRTSGIRLVKEILQHHPPCKVDCARMFRNRARFHASAKDPINRQLLAMFEDVARRTVRIRAFQGEWAVVVE